MTMRKPLNDILLLMAMVLCCTGISRAQDILANGIYYNIISDTQVAVAPAYWDGANHYEGSIILPERVYCDGVNYDVSAIAPRAFWQSGVTEVQIPNSVTVIGEAAFADAEELANITLPLKLTAVSRYMLAGTAVTNIVLPEGVTDIGAGAFEDCSQLHTMFLPATLQRIGSRAFGYCNNLSEIFSDASNPPLTMDDNTFDGCGTIHVMLPDAGTTRRYQNDGIWGDDEQFSLWVDEGLAVMPMMQQEDVNQSWTALKLGGNLAYKIYGPDGYLTALTAADRYYLPTTAQSSEYIAVPTTLMYDEEDLQLVADAQSTAIEEIDESEPENKLTIVGLDRAICVEGNIQGLRTSICAVYGMLWYDRVSSTNWFNLPGPRMYIVRVGDVTRKVFLN